MPASNDVDKALQLLMGDFIRKKPYMMMSSNPEEGDVVIKRFRTITDARRYAKVNGIEDYTLWSELKLKRKTIREKASTSDEDIDKDEEMDEEIDEDELDDDELDDDELDDDDDELDDDLV